MKRKFRLSKLTAGAVACTMFVTTCVTSFVSAYTPAYGSTTSDAVSEREKKNANLSMEAATEGMVLLQNQNNTLPIEAKGNIALFGGGACKTAKGGAGAGNVNERYNVSVKDAFENAGYNVTSSEWLDNYKTEFNKGQEEWEEKNKNNPYKEYLQPFSLSDYVLTDDDITAASESDTAIYVISRSSGEGTDRTTAKGDYFLTDAEYANIKRMAEYFKNSIVVLNVGGVVDTKFVKEIPELDSVLLMSLAGMEGGTAAVKVLNGEVTPSGKLTDTWAENYSDYPSSETFSGNDKNVAEEDYREDIYVGYRYFDSFNVKPAYEFGYGLSYATFDMNVVSVEADEKQVTVKVKVKNTGKYSGKEVAQVYFSALDGKLDKPYQELAGYGKTDLLAPGESQVLTISYNTSEMSSYSEEDAAYIMESDNYIVRVGNSSRNTHVGAVLTLDSTVTTEQLSNQRKIDRNIGILSVEGDTPYSYAEEANEIANTQKIQLSSGALDLIDGDNASEYDDETVTTYVANDADKNETTTSSSVNANYTETRENVEPKKDTKLYDVYNKDITMEQFVAGLPVEKLANIVNGIGTAVSQTPVVGAQANAVAGGAGETTGEYYETDGIPNIVLADGPAGLRLTKQYNKDVQTWYQYATAWPIGTLLAQTWNLDIMEEVNDAVAIEMLEFGVTLWLAPGMNIHRDPLCGRNFEYFSEDPFLTGTMGLAATKGVQSHPGIGVTIKHYAANNQENNRNLVNETISERALREIYLKGYEISIKGGQPMAIMSAFNKINGVYEGSDYDLMTDIARGEWNFDGLIMTDWYSKANPDESMHSGNDLIMPGATQDAIIKAVSDYAPVFGQDGYVSSKTVYDYYGRGTSVEQWNDFTPSVDGEVTVSTKVPAGTALNDKIKGMVDAEEASVTFDTTEAEASEDEIIEAAVSTDEATESETGLEESTEETSGSEVIESEGNINQTTEEAVTYIYEESIEPVASLDSDPMTDTSRDRIVTYYGSYADNNTIYLGDLQKSAMRVLNIIMQSSQFEKMNSDKGVKVESYTEKYDNLKNYLTLSKEDIVAGSSGSNGGTTTGGSSSHHHNSGSSSSSSDSSTTSDSNSNNVNSNDGTVEVKNKWNKNLDGTWSFVNSNGEKATGWIQDGNSWYNLDLSGKMQTGWLKDNDGSWYFLNINGAMSIGWLKDNVGNWYYLNDSGAMKTGWLKDDNEKWYYLDTNGAMKTGWLKDTDGKWYYLNANGEMTVDTVIDGYTVDSTGAWVS